VESPAKKHPAGVKQRLLRRLAHNFVDALKADIEASMSALAATIKRGRNYYDDRHPAHVR
jgi:hypothetical protein